MKRKYDFGLIHTFDKQDVVFKDYISFNKWRRGQFIKKSVYGFNSQWLFHNF